LLSPLRVSPRSSFRKLERHCGISKPSLNPTSEASQNKVEIPVPFFARQKRASTYQLCHTIHHNFTTKTQQPNTHFPQNSCKNEKSTMQKKPQTISQKVA
jgi:hypothetical protein